jgi:DNA repair protein RecO (recombination protein O)
MEWRDHGIVLSVRRHGENAAIIEVFTPSHGRHAGVVRGGASRRIAPVLQPGAQVDLAWKARLEEHMGHFAVEPLRSRAAAMADRMALAGLNAVCALLCFCLPEREAHPALYRRTEMLLDLLGDGELWPLAYLRWELALREETGFGLDLGSCAVTGATEGLVHVSPRSGRAVARGAAGEWESRMLPLSPCLRGEGEAPDAEIVEALGTTGYFLNARLAPELGTRPLPEARQRYVDLLARRVRAGA